MGRVPLSGPLFNTVLIFFRIQFWRFTHCGCQTRIEMEWKKITQYFRSLFQKNRYKFFFPNFLQWKL
jgi:hypothetical protein